VDVEDLEGLFKKGVVVEQGTKALIFINGALAETLQPGAYDLNNRQINFTQINTGTAILVDAGDVALQMDLKGIYTSDPLAIDLTCNIVMQVDTPVFFFNNVMKGRRNYLRSELKRSLYDELMNAFSEAIGKKSVTDLNHELSLKRQFEVMVENHLKTTFQRNGFNFIQLRTMDYRFQAFDKVRDINEAVFLLVSEEEAKLQGRKRIFDVYDKNQLQELFEETRKTEHYRKMSAMGIDRARAEAEADLGFKTVEADKEIDEWKLAAETRRRLKGYLLDKTRTDDEIESYLNEIEKGKFLREQEIKELKRTYSEKDEDHEIKRQFMLKKLDLEQELDYERARLTGKAGIEIELFELEEKKKRMQLESEMLLEKLREGGRIEVELKRHMAKIEAEQAEDLADLEIARISQEMMLNMKRKKIQLELYEKMQNMLIDLEAEEGRLKLQLEAEKAQHEREMEKIRVSQDHELLKIAALSNASAEAIISMSGPEQAALIQQLKQTEAMKGMSAEEIMAIKDTATLAKAFEEKYKGVSKEEIDKMYKMVVEAKDKSAAEKDKMMADTMAMVERLTTRALDSQKDAAVGVAQGAAHGVMPNVVYPPQGQPGVYGAPAVFNAPGHVFSPGSATVVICSNCKSEVRTGVKYCNNCGNQMF
jgi:hypothetical protein